MSEKNPTEPTPKKLKDTDPANCFLMPDGYFDELKSKVFDRIHSDEGSGVLPVQEKRPLHVVLRPYLYLAAMFVGMALLFKALPLITPPEPATTKDARVQALTDEGLIRQVSEEEFKQYLLEETQDEYLLATVFE